MLNNHEANLTDEEAAAEVARVAKTYPVVRLLSADQIKSVRASLTAYSPAIAALVCVGRVLRPWKTPMRYRSNCSTMVLSTAPVCAI